VALDAYTHNVGAAVAVQAASDFMQIDARLDGNAVEV